jgi:hypothetical protein
MKYITLVDYIVYHLCSNCFLLSFEGKLRSYNKHYSDCSLFHATWWLFFFVFWASLSRDTLWQEVLPLGKVLSHRTQKFATKCFHTSVISPVQRRFWVVLNILVRIPFWIRSIQIFSKIILRYSFQFEQVFVVNFFCCCGVSLRLVFVLFCYRVGSSLN